MARPCELDPRDADLWGGYAFLLYKERRCREARGYFEEALRLAPENAEILLNYAALLEEIGDPERAERLRERARRIEENKNKTTE